MNRTIGYFVLLGYATAILCANYLTSRYGMVPVAPGVTATAGTFAAGAAFLLRDVLQDTLGRIWVSAGIVGGAALTAITSPALAVASTVAFLVAEASDMTIYTPLRKRGWARAATVSNLVGAAIDTLLFLWIAGFPITSAALTGQMVGKFLWATGLPVLLVLAYRWGQRVVPRDAVGA